MSIRVVTDSLPRIHEGCNSCVRRAGGSRDVRVIVLRDAVERGIDCLAQGFASGEPRERMRAFLDRRR